MNGLRSHANFLKPALLSKSLASTKLTLHLNNLIFSLQLKEKVKDLAISIVVLKEWSIHSNQEEITKKKFHSPT